MSKNKSLSEQIASSDEDPWETHMRRFCEAVKDGKAPDPETLRFTATAFEKIRQGEDPKQAFAIRRKRGPKRDRGLGIQIAVYIDNKIRNGTPRGKAIEDAAGQFCRSEKLVELRYDENKELFRVAMEMGRAISNDLETVQSDLNHLRGLLRSLVQKKPQ